MPVNPEEWSLRPMTSLQNRCPGPWSWQASLCDNGRGMTHFSLAYPDRRSMTRFLHYRTHLLCLTPILQNTVRTLATLAIDRPAVPLTNREGVSPSSTFRRYETTV